MPYEGNCSTWDEILVENLMRQGTKIEGRIQYVHLHRARRCQFYFHPSDGPRKPYCEDTFGMILRTQPNLPHQRRSLQMGGGHPVPIGRGLRGNTSLPYPPPRCIQPRSSSPSRCTSRVGTQTAVSGTLASRRLPSLPLLFPSVPSCTTMRPPVKVPPPHVVKSAETSPVGTYDSAAGAEQIEISYAKPHGIDHQVNVAPLHVLGAGRVPSTSCVSPAGTEQAETSMDIDLLVTGSLWFPHDSLWSYVHMDDGDITDSLKFSRTTVADDVLGSHCVSKEKPRLALLTAPAARRSTRTSLDEACGKSAPCTSGLTVVQWNTGPKAGPQSSACRRHCGCRRRALPSTSRSPLSNSRWYPTLRQTDERPFSGTATRFFTPPSIIRFLGESKGALWMHCCLHLPVWTSPVRLATQCHCGERSHQQPVRFRAWDLPEPLPDPSKHHRFRACQLVCGDFRARPLIELAFGHCEIPWPPHIPLYGALGVKLDSWTWHDVVKFPQDFLADPAPWFLGPRRFSPRIQQIRPRVALRGTEPAAVRIRLRKLRSSGMLELFSSKYPWIKIFQ